MTHSCMKRSADSVCQKCVATHTGNVRSACVRDVFTPDEFTMSPSDEELVAASQALEAVASDRDNLSDEELLIASQRVEDMSSVGVSHSQVGLPVCQLSLSCTKIARLISMSGLTVHLTIYLTITNEILPVCVYTVCVSIQC